MTTWLNLLHIAHFMIFFLFSVLSFFVSPSLPLTSLSGLPSSSAASDCGRHSLYPYLSGLHPRTAGPAPAGKADLWNPVAVLPVYPVCPTQVPQRGKVGYQCDGHSPYSADSCQALLLLHAHPAMSGGLLSSLPSTLWWRGSSVGTSGPGVRLWCSHQS